MILRLVPVSAFLGVSLAVASASAQDVPATPPPQPAIVEPPADPPPTPTVSNRNACGLVAHSCKVPHLALAIDGGVSAFNESGPFGFNTGIGSITSAGPAWGARVGVELLKWFAIDVHYSGMDNHATGAGTPNGSVHLLTNAGTGELRFTAPLPYVQPYLFAGAGVYSTSITGSASAKAASPLFGHTEFGVPLGVGLKDPRVVGGGSGCV